VYTAMKMLAFLLFYSALVMKNPIISSQCRHFLPSHASICENASVFTVNFTVYIYPLPIGAYIVQVTLIVTFSEKKENTEKENDAKFKYNTVIRIVVLFLSFSVLCFVSKFPKGVKRP
jgi:heme/copper-type cytochrome/quinol oxidase subunit 2